MLREMIQHLESFGFTDFGYDGKNFTYWFSVYDDVEEPEEVAFGEGKTILEAYTNIISSIQNATDEDIEDEDE